MSVNINDICNMFFDGENLGGLNGLFGGGTAFFNRKPLQDSFLQFFKRDGGKSGAVRKQRVQSASLAGYDGLAEGEGFDDDTAERFAVGTGDNDIGGGDFGQGGFIGGVEGKDIIQSKSGRFFLQGS